jgi:hypothetical protein
MPNRFLLYFRLGSATDRRSGYDAIDANIDLPALTIASEIKDRKLDGAVFVEHEFRRIGMARQVAALVTRWPSERARQYSMAPPFYLDCTKQPASMPVDLAG